MIPKYIVIHHSWSDDRGTLDWPAIRRYHIEENGWHDIGYHYGIEKVNQDWAIITGRMESTQGAHCVDGGMNRQSIGICVIGNFDSEQLNQEAFLILVTLCVGLCKRYDIPAENIVPHNKYATYKTCPGKKFPMGELVAQVKEYLG
jgi:N-acetyl-anhydromuramyl-L-alanine amidase AmpD